MDKDFRRFSILDYYKQYSSQFLGIQDFFDYLINHSSVYFDTLLHPNYKIDPNRLYDMEQDEIIIVENMELPDWVEFSTATDDYVQVSNGKIVSGKFLRDNFISRAIKLEVQKLKILLASIKLESLEQIEQNDTGSIYEQLGELHEVNVYFFEEPLINFLQLYLIDEAPQENQNKNIKLQKYFRPRPDYRSGEVFIDGQYISEKYNKEQAVLLKELYENSLSNPDYVYKQTDILSMIGKGSSPDEQTRVKNLFPEKKIKNYISNKNRGIWFNFNKNQK